MLSAVTLFVFLGCSLSFSLGTDDPFSFNVLQWNIFRRQLIVSHDGQKEREQIIPTYVSKLDAQNNIDAITFCEAWVDSDIIVGLLKPLGFPYATKLLTDDDPLSSLTNGGVIIVSKHPILREDQIVYHGDCHFADCLAAKGVKYARIEKTNPSGNKKIFNLFATHMQAWDTNQTHADRRKQAQQLYSFIQENNFSSEEPVLIAGDLNTDLGLYIEETKAVFNIMNAKMPKITGYNYTIDPSENLLVGRDGGADPCNDAYKKSWGPFVDGVYQPSPETRVPCKGSTELCFCPCCPFQWLDYVLYSAGHQQPISLPTIEVIKAAVPGFIVPWKAIGPVVTEKIKMWDLSDHYPVLAKFEFDYLSPPIIQDGCKNDNDCHFSWGYCYCTGPSCTLNGTVVDGSKFGPYDSINSACHFNKWTGKCICHF